jgi:hypothetical protein
MGIDRIGKGGAAPPGGSAGPASSGSPSSTERAGEAERAFEVRPAGAEARTTDASVVAGAAPSSALERLRAGKIDLQGYVDQKVEEATAHLHGLGAEQLEAIRSMLRAQVVNDPALADLVTQAAGQAERAPKPEEP